MIVRADRDRLLLITQPDHSRMAGEVMSHCAALADHPRRAAILRACAEHDGGWIEVDRWPDIDVATGKIIDFMTAPTLTKQTVWPRAIARLADDPWAAALVAQHAITVYGRLADDPLWASFFPDLAALRDLHVRASGHAPAALAADYAFVRLADLISLTFCNAWPDPQTYGEWTVRGNGEHVSVTPDAFGGAIVPFTVPARVLPITRFRSALELRTMMEAAPIETLAGTVGAAADATGR